jgi:hypothetical protein
MQENIVFCENNFKQLLSDYNNYKANLADVLVYISPAVYTFCKKSLKLSDSKCENVFIEAIEYIKEEIDDYISKGCGFLSWLSVKLREKFEKSYYLQNMFSMSGQEDSQSLFRVTQRNLMERTKKYYEAKRSNKAKKVC